jgi:hypothetical protein
MSSFSAEPLQSCWFLDLVILQISIKNIYNILFNLDSQKLNVLIIIPIFKRINSRRCTDIAFNMAFYVKEWLLA